LNPRTFEVGTLVARYRAAEKRFRTGANHAPV
jgi:hypothetical protein